MAKDWYKDIWVTAGGQYTSTTSPKSQGVKGNDNVMWQIKGAMLPLSAEVELRFNSNKVVSALVLSDGGMREISAKVKNKGLKKGDSFPYKVWFVDGATQYEMEDPELVMDGDTPPIAIKKKAAKKKAAKKKAKKR